MRVEFWEPMRIPTVTHNNLEIHTRKKGGKRIPFIGKSRELLEAESKWEAHLAPHTPKRPLEGPLFLDLTIVFHDADVPHGVLELMAGKPDCDNLVKTIQDAMERLGWFSDGDQQVCDLHVSKYRADTEGVSVDLRELVGADAQSDEISD